MRDTVSARAPGATFLMLAAGLLLLLSTSWQATAQEPGRNSREMSERELRNRQRNLRILDKVARASGTTPDQEKRLALVQIKKDFEGMQASDNVILTEISSGRMDMKLIGDALSEIKRQAARLRANMVLPEATKEERAKLSQLQPGSAELRKSLLNLDQLIAKFVANPVFRNTGVVDARGAVIAGLDLDSINTLSDSIKKEMERVSKNSRH